MNSTKDNNNSEGEQTAPEIQFDLDAHAEYLARSNGIELWNEDQMEPIWKMRFKAGIKELMETGEVSMENLRGTVMCDSFAGLVTMRSGREVNMIFVDPCENASDEVLYFITLHEIAHQVLKHEPASKVGRDRVIEQEIEANEWAFEHSIIEPSDDVFIAMMDALATYTDAFERDSRIDEALQPKVEQTQQLGV